MAKKSGKNPLGDKYGKRAAKAHAQYKDDETNFGSFSDLPPGVNGVAKLIDLKVGTYDKGDNVGEPYFSASGIVVSPRDHDGERIEGRRTLITEPLCDTPGRSREEFEEHWGWMLNELRKLGVDTSEMGPEDLEDTLEALKGDPDDPDTWTFFRFRTWQGKPTPQYPDPRTNHSWMGACDWDASEVEEDGDTDDDTEEAEESPPPKKAVKKPVKKETPKPSKAPTKGKAKSPEPPDGEGEPEEEEEEAFDEFGDLNQLAKKADKGDEKAGAAIKKAAVKLGIPAKKIDAAKDWGTVVVWMEEVKSVDVDAEEEEETPEEEETEEESDESEEEAEPMKEDVYKFRPLDPKTKKPTKKPVECEVTAVDKKKRTVTLKSIDDPSKVYKAVAWDDLIRPPEDE